MDISQFNSRARAEEGTFVSLVNPYSGEAIADGKTGFHVRGTAAKSVQARMAELQRKARDEAESASEDEAKAVMEGLHEGQIEAAMKYIIRADDEMTNGGKKVGDDPEQIRAVLDMTFPDMQAVKDEKGERVTRVIKDKDGSDVVVPKFEIVNRTFAQQVIEAAEDGSRFFGKMPKG